MLLANGTPRFKCVHFFGIQNNFLSSKRLRHSKCYLFAFVFFLFVSFFVCFFLRCYIFLDFQVYFAGKRGYDPSFTDNHEIVLRNSSRSTEIGVEKLKPGTEYSIYVKARTVKGYGAESDRVERKTPSKRMRTFFVHLCEHVGT